jgi:3-deoxy-D-manno-octulosonic-acid transferase
MKRWIAMASELAFKGLHATESLFGLPKSVSDPLHFRETWDSVLSGPAPAPTLWIHGASVGELEDLANFFLDQASLEAAGYSVARLVVTASSPSAKPFLAKVRERFPLAYAGAIPSENPDQIRIFLEKLKPELLVLSHSDLWPSLIHLAQELALQKGIVWMPAKPSSAEGLFETLIRHDKLRAVGVRRAEDLETLQTRLSEYTTTQFVWVGNPRLDRIINRINEQRACDHHILEESRARPDTLKLSLLMGSAWPEDATVLAETIGHLTSSEQERIQIVVIPHVTDEMHVVASIQHLLPKARILRLQGVLLEAYQDFDLAFVGGGFRTGLHSVLEPALWGLPIFCGPQLRKQPEAQELEDQGVLKTVVSTEELALTLRHYLDSPETLETLRTKSQAIADQMKASTGASKRLSRLVGASSLGSDAG